MRKITWIAAAALVLVALAPAHPEAGQQPAQAAGAQRGMRGFGQLDLTEAQHEKMDQLRMSFLKETMPLKTDIKLKEMELNALWRAEKLNTKAIVAKVKEIAGIRTKLEVARVNRRINRYNVLTPEQQKNARHMLGRRGRGKMRGMRRGMRQGRGQGRMMRQGRQGQGRMRQFAPPNVKESD